MATGTLRTTHPSTRALHIGLWCVQVLLAAIYLMSGSAKAFTPYSELADKMSWVSTFTPGVIRLIGWCELLGALGLILPAATRIQPLLTAWAGTGLATLMLFAALLHLSRREYPMLPLVLILGLLDVLVAWGRFRRAPIPPREPTPVRAARS
jgi:putative oxidoreductase